MELYGLTYVSRLQQEARELSECRGTTTADGRLCDGRLSAILGASNKSTIFPPHLFGELIELLEAELASATSKLSASGSSFQMNRMSSQRGQRHSLARRSSQPFALFYPDGFEEVLRASSHLQKYTTPRPTRVQPQVLSMSSAGSDARRGAPAGMAPTGRNLSRRSEGEVQGHASPQSGSRHYSVTIKFLPVSV